MPNQPSPRRRFQFRLRTLMIGVTLLSTVCGVCNYVSSQAELVRERKAILAATKQRDYGGAGLLAVLTDAKAKTRHMFPPYRIDEIWKPHFKLLAIADDNAEPTEIQKWFGIEMVRVLVFGRGTPSSEVNRVMDLFPEATVYQYESGAPSNTAARAAAESQN